MNRNVVLVTIDSLRADHCGFIDDDAPGVTPTLDALAAQGIVFERAVAPGPRTPSSMPETFTGHSIALDDGAPKADYWQERRALIRRHMRQHRGIADRLRDRGYTTVGVTVNPWTQGTAFDRGFDRYVEINGDALEAYGPPVFRLADRLLHGNRVGDRLFWHNKREWFIRWTDFYDTIRSAFETADAPVFLWVFLLDVHQPYVSPARYRRESSAFGMYYSSLSELSRGGRLPDHAGEWLQRAYRDSVRSVDGFIQRLWADCAHADPVIVVHSDHGEAFGEHGAYGHERQLYRENLHVPAMVANAGVARRVADPFSLRRLPDLVTAIAAGDEFEPARFTTPCAFAATEGREQIAATGRDWAYISGESGDELYHTGSDPEQRTNLADRRPGLTRAFGRLVRQHLANDRERALIANAVRQFDCVEREDHDERSQEVFTQR